MSLEDLISCRKLIFTTGFFLADNLQRILLAKEVETAKERQRAQKQVMKEMRLT